MMGDDPEKRGARQSSSLEPSKRSSPRSTRWWDSATASGDTRTFGKHTKQVVRQAVPRIEVRWGALFHDIGKLKTRTFSPDGKVHFRPRGSGQTDVRQTRTSHGLFRQKEALRETIRFLVLHHLRANQYEPEWTDSAVRRFARELGDHLDDLICLARADITTKRPEKKRKVSRRSRSSTAASLNSRNSTLKHLRSRAASGTRSCARFRCDLRV